jgi:hypothetical protein
MISNSKSRKRSRQPVKYAVIAGLIAVLSVVMLEATGTVMSGNYTGLDGKLGTTATQISPAAAPAR